MISVILSLKANCEPRIADSGISVNPSSAAASSPLAYDNHCLPGTSPLHSHCTVLCFQFLRFAAYTSIALASVATSIAVCFNGKGNTVCSDSTALHLKLDTAVFAKLSALHCISALLVSRRDGGLWRHCLLALAS